MHIKVEVQAISTVYRLVITSILSNDKLFPYSCFEDASRGITQPPIPYNEYNYWEMSLESYFVPYKWGKSWIGRPRLKEKQCFLVKHVRIEEEHF